MYKKKFNLPKLLINNKPVTFINPDKIHKNNISFDSTDIIIKGYKKDISRSSYLYDDDAIKENTNNILEIKNIFNDFNENKNYFINEKNNNILYYCYDYDNNNKALITAYSKCNNLLGWMCVDFSVSYYYDKYCEYNNIEPNTLHKTDLNNLKYVSALIKSINIRNNVDSETNDLIKTMMLKYFKDNYIKKQVNLLVYNHVLGCNEYIKQSIDVYTIYSNSKLIPYYKNFLSNPDVSFDLNASYLPDSLVKISNNFIFYKKTYDNEYNYKVFHHIFYKINSFYGNSKLSFIKNDLLEKWSKEILNYI